jgi:asparagine synthase (glutamine-hydrolysing)
MCGIAGIVSLEGRPVLDRELRAMCRAMHHRGPDDDGFYLDERAGLGMRRLSIIDIAGGRQPVHNEDRSVWAVFNGEIYNFQELRRHLETRGHFFRTHTDTEVIVHLYEEYGIDCVDHLRGMFTFALWDKGCNELLLARDRLGIKPLYYAEAGGRLVFASELKCLLELPEVGRDLNWKSVAHLFTFLTTPADESIIQGIHKLQPGHVLSLSPGKAPVVKRYWGLKFEPDRGKSLSYFVEQTRERLAESVKLHMISDVPLGAFLSGGIDSSAVVATASKASSGPLRTFSIGFKESDYNELEYARAVAAHFGTDHHDLILEPQSFDELDGLSWYLDEPFGDSSAIPTYMVSKLAADHGIKVILSGDGGDELFAGYERYAVEQKERQRPELPGPVRSMLGWLGEMAPPAMRGRNFVRHYALDGPARYLDACTLFRRDDLRALFEPEFAEMLAPHEPWRAKAAQMQSGDGHWLSAIQNLDINNYLPLDILTKVDRMSMAHSIETRVPFLDHKLVEFAATIPPEMSLQGETTKAVLKNAMRGTLPDSIIDRPKKGFAVPLRYWFRGKLSSYARDLLLGDRARRRGIFKPEAIEQILSRHEHGQDLDLQLWTLLSFELWSATFLDQTPQKHHCAVT